MINANASKRVKTALKVLQATIQGAAADLAHSGGRDGAEGPDEVGLDPGGRLEGEHTGSPQQVHWHLNRGGGRGGGGRVHKNISIQWNPSERTPLK